jgi:anti-sigma factor RsiW
MISTYIDGSLPHDRQETLQRHLAGCTGCAAYLKELSALRSAIRSPNTITPSPYFYAKVRRRMTNPERTAVPLLVRLQWAAAFAAGTVLVLALLTGNFFGKNLISAFSPTASDAEIASSNLGLNVFDDGPEESVTAVYNDTMRG